MRTGECNHCGWCCQYLGQTTAVVDNLAGLSDVPFYRTRGFAIGHAEGVPVRAERTVWQYAPCPEHVEGRCRTYDTRPETCRLFPTRAAQIVGTPCSYRF
jgi:Fe-S-cluster containining protein